MPFSDKTVQTFLDELASKAPVPGGGSGAALGGAMAAALLSMVCNLTLGKKGYDRVQDEITDLLQRSETLRSELVTLMEADTEVYGRFRETYRMARKTTEEKAARQAAMQSALTEAARVPMEIAESCRQLVELALLVAQLGNTGLVSDAGVGVLMADAALQSALLNVQINLKSIKDPDLATALKERMAAVTDSLDTRKAEVLAVVTERMG